VTVADAFPGALSSDGLAFAVAWQEQVPDPPPPDQAPTVY
jgi:hypothetical protein